MGCSASRLEDEEAVRLCRDRKGFIKQAVEQRTRFASGHLAYIQSLKRVCAALHNYVDGDEHHDLFSDSCSTPPFTPVKRLSPEIIGIPSKSFSPLLDLPSKGSRVVHYLRSGGNPAVSVEERPQSPESVRIASYYPSEHYGIDGFFTMQSPPMNSSFFSSSPHNAPSYPPPSPQQSQWDLFWNPFSSLDTYGYPSQYSPDRAAVDDENAGLRQIREEEGIPDLEEEEEVTKSENVGKACKVETNEVEEMAIEHPDELNPKSDTIHPAKECQSDRADSIEVSKMQRAAELDINHAEELTGNRETAEETPGFTVYMNRRPASMAEVIRDIEHQFIRIYDSAHEVSLMLEASRAQYSSTSNELTAVKMLNPVTLFRSASFRSASSRFLQSSIPKDDEYETSSDFSEDFCMMPGSHQSTLDRLYAWEKKLYEEVKSGERIRIAYERKCKQLRNHDVNGEDPSIVDKTRITMRDLHTKLKVSIRAVEAISKRIETLRDQELHPQLMELIGGLGRMWRTMADCHHVQKRTIDEAKLLLASTPRLLLGGPGPAGFSRPAARLEAELRHWRCCLHNWVSAQRSYARALAGWLLRCARLHGGDDDAGDAAARSPLSPPRSSGAPPVFGLCTQWSRLLDAVREERALEGLDFFVAGVYTVAGQQREAEEAARRGARVPAGLEIPAAPSEADVEADVVATVTPEKAAEVAVKVLCAGMSVALTALAEFAAGSRDVYEELRRRFPTGRTGDGDDGRS